MNVYFDHAATTPINQEVADAMVQVICEESGNPSSIHAQGRRARTLIEKSRKSIAQALNVDAGSIFFTSSATEANNTILRKAVDDLGVKTIVSTSIEHACVKNTIQELKDNEKIEHLVIPVDQEGTFTLETFRDVLSQATSKTLVTCMYGNNEIGNIFDIKNMASIAKEAGALFHTDAVQMIGKYPVDLEDLNVDFASATAHKINGPKGIGLMYINPSIQISPFQTGGSQERNMRAGTENIYGIVGFAKAVEVAIRHQEERHTYVSDLNTYFRDALLDIEPNISFNGSAENSMYHICSVNFPDSPRNRMLIYNLDIKGICISSGSACSSGSNIGSHVIGALKHKQPFVTLRFSFSHRNTKEEIDYTISILREVLTNQPVHAG